MWGQERRWGRWTLPSGPVLERHQASNSKDGCPLLPIICLAMIVNLLLNLIKHIVQKEPLVNKLLLLYFSNLFCHLVETG